jgi:PAS domain S-box-containing protein
MIEQESPLEQPVKHDSATDKLVYKYWPGFAFFIRENHMVEYAQDLLRLSREADLPLMKLIAHMPEEQLLALTIQNHGEFLEKVEKNQLMAHLQEGLKRWEDNDLEIISNDEIATEDITLGTLIRKKAMMRFLPLYTQDAFEMLEIIREIDDFDAEALTVSTKLHFNILKGKIQEQLHFIEKISQTTPGLTYVYDLEKSRHKYANDNYLNFFGLQLKDIWELNGDFFRNSMHPEDYERSMEVMGLIPRMSNTDTLTLENRLKNSEGKYRWMRHYFSIFKRDEQNNPSDVIAIAFDIENEKRASEQLAKSEEQLLDAQAIGEIGSFEWVFGNVKKTTVTPQLLKIYDLDSVVEFPQFMNNVHPTDRPKVQECIDKAINETGIYECEYRYIKNDVEKIIWSRGIIVRSNGEPYSMRGTIMDVTERQHMILRLQRSEELYKQAQALSHMGNYAYDIVHNRIHWTDEIYRIFGLEPQSEEIDFEKFVNFVHPEDREGAVAAVKKSIEKKQAHNFYYRIITPQGQEKIIHAIGEVLIDTDGTVYKFIGTAQDVTEKQNLIDRLQDSDARFKQAQAMSHIGSWTWDLATDEVIWTEELFRIYDADYVEGGKIDLAYATSFRHPEDKSYVASMIDKVIKGKTQHQYQYRIISSTGRTKILQGITEPIMDESGRIQKIIGTVQDVTDKVMAEQQIKTSREFINKIANTAPSIITTYNINTGEYNFVSDGIKKLLGYDAEEVLTAGVTFFNERLHPDDLEEMNAKNSAALEMANQAENIDLPIVEEFKYRVKAINGEYRWLHTYGTVFDRDAQGRVEQVLNISVDITAQVEAEQALQQRNIQLQQSNSSLEDYAYVASHDLKEPLRKIATFSDRLLITQKDQLTEDGQNYLTKIIDSSKRMQAMISDLLAVSTISGNKSFEEYSLQNALQEAIQTLEHKIEEKNVKIEASDLPAARVVPSQLRQLFQNLISNSLKFAKKDIQPQIKVTASYIKPGELNNTDVAKASRYIKISFSDNGIGFDNSYSEKIFSIFQRLHGRTEYEGTGIGLAICRKVAENHGGTIYAEGKPGEGAKFTIILPA